MVLAGGLLAHVQAWEVFRAYPELLILVPALLGLKGNLEMTLASRLSTQANLGQLEDWRGQAWEIARANLALVQLQGIVVGGLAAVIPMASSHFWEGTFTVSKGLLLTTSSVVTASLASLMLSCVMILVIGASTRFGLNPDNLATPIAASLGDLVTLAILSHVANFLRSSPSWICPGLITFYLVLLPMLQQEASRHERTAHILTRDGWTPVLAAMVLSSVGGKILHVAVSAYPLASYQPVINGVAGNLVSVQASRISTSLHRKFSLGQPLPESVLNSCTKEHDRTAKLLLSLVVPGHLFFLLVMRAGDLDGGSELSMHFMVVYLAACLLQVAILLRAANVLIVTLWQQKIDPDDAAVPYLTAMGDLLGGAFLAATFYLCDDSEAAV